MAQSRTATRTVMPPRDRSTSFGFFPAAGTNYSAGDEPTIASRLDALGKALKLRLTGISGFRTPAHSVAVGGSANDPHTQGKASDTPGVENVSESVLERFGLTRPFGGAKEADHIQLLPSTRRRATQTSMSGVPSYVPKAWIPWVGTAASGTGMPAAVVAAQIDDESGFQLDVTSPAGAEGPAQFLPSTFKQYGPKNGSPFNQQDSLVAYQNYMNALLSQYDGNIRKALAAYNAGPNNIAAGYGYADTILAKAGAPRTAQAGSPSSFGGTRPGGQSTDATSGSDTGAGVDQVFSDYEAEVTLPRTAPASTFTSPGSAGWSAPAQWWWQSFSGQYAKEQGGG